MAKDNQHPSQTFKDAIRTDGRRSGVPVAEPSVLRSQATLTLHTRQAQRLVFGRKAEPKRQPIFGLMRFAATARTIWNGAAMDDPWADQALIRIEEVIEAGNERIASLQQHLNDRLAALPQAIRIEPAQAVEPYQVDLQFATPHAYQATYLLAAYDQLVCSILTARHIGLLNRLESQHLLDEGGRSMRYLFYLGQQYRFMGVTREDVRQGTAKAKRAADTLGELPELIISGELRPVLRPETTSVREQKPVADTGVSVLDDLVPAAGLNPLALRGSAADTKSRKVDVSDTPES